MKDKILQFAKGNFENSQAALQLSENNLMIQVEEGREYQGSFYIGNAGGVSMKGILYSECQYIDLKQTQFTGDEVSIEYTIKAEELLTGETVETQIDIVSSCGEVCLPVIITVEKPAITVDDIRITDLTGFAELARTKPEEAVRVFTSDEFEPILLHRDIDNQILYNSLKKSSSNYHAVEEFLIASRKKNRITLEVDKNNLYYSNCRMKSLDGILLTRSTWGCMDISIYSDVKFIIPSCNKLRTDLFAKDTIGIEFVLDPEQMHYGKNHGCLFIETAHQKLDIRFECVRPVRESAGDNSCKKKLTADLLNEYLQFRKNEITADEYVLNMDTLLVENRNQFSDIMLAAWQAHTAFAAGQMEAVNEYVKQLVLLKRPAEGASIEDVIEYAAACYAAAITAAAAERDRLIAHAVREIRYLYDNGYECWQMLWFLLNIDSKYNNGHTAYIDVIDCIKKGCTSPVIYMEFCWIIKNNPELMHEWDEYMIKPLSWGIREKLFDREMAVAFTYHVSRIKSFNKMVFISLCRLYDNFELDDTLQAICVMLIKADKAAARYFRWYELGVEKQLRITQIYEYYMQSLGGTRDKILPNQVLMYFMYDNHLGKRERSALYAAAIRGKDVNPSAYKAYTLMIYNYARKQLEEGNIDSDLAVIYEDSIKINEIDETIAKALPEVMFRNEIICSNTHMKGVCVVHRELEEEVYVPFINGRAYVNIYTDNSYIFLVDNNDYRYFYANDYTQNKMLNLDDYAEACFNIMPDNKRLLAYMFGKCENDFQLSKEIINIRYYVKERLNLRSSYKKKNISALLNYYYEHAEYDYLDGILKNVNLGEADRDIRQKWIEMLISRGMEDQALLGCVKYGYQGVDVEHLRKFCDKMIESNGINEKNDLLVKMAYSIFITGQYSSRVLEYLGEHYMGSTDKMYELWQKLNCSESQQNFIEERLLSQMLFTEYDVERGMEVLESYLDSNGNVNLEKAYISYLAYQYLINNQDISSKIWRWMKDTLLVSDNTVCTLAILKWYSRCSVLNEDETKFCDIKISLMLQKDIILPYFREYLGKINLPGDIEDRVFVECIARPGTCMKIKYSYGAEKSTITKVKEVFYGIYVKSFVVFEGESVQYEFYEEKDSGKYVLSKGTVTYNQNNINAITRFGILNRMIECVKDEEIDELYAAMSSYIKLDNTSKQLFKIL